MTTFRLHETAFFLLLLLLLFPAQSASALPEAPLAANSASAELSRARVELFADPAAVAPGGTFTVALSITLKEGWHTYWLNPGEAGMAPRVKIDCGMGARPLTGRTEWPVPTRFGADGMVTYGYEGTVIALREFEVAPDQLPGENIALTASVQLLFCKETCEAGGGDLAILIPVERARRADPERTKAMAIARERLPSPAVGSSGTVVASVSDGAILLRVTLPAGDPVPPVADFFPIERGLLSPTARPEPTPAPDGYTLRLPLDPNAGPLPGRLRGILTEGPHARAVDVPLPSVR